MKFYTVNITQTDVYQITVPAESPEEAERLAIEAHVNAENQDVNFSHCEDRTAKAVTETGVD